ncbi:glycosyltransferase [Scandinavium manionii]|uniref:glycosyltransferase n=1 Tax=Scandinavium manionii TaxID=2926520 RepID=UPI0021653771|nr:glycosyltransferase [Scandinavium manionii]MCS2168271.1 glycosyltransferase [Scandinavium manionii]
MGLLINASNLYVGGGVQVAVSLIQELVSNGVEFKAAISPKVQEQLCEKELKQCILIKKTPSGIFNFKTRRLLNEIVKEYRIEKVLTIFGPSYWSPKNVMHVVGFALPWLIYDTSNIYAELTLKQKIKFQILKIIQPYFYKKNADVIVTETEDVNHRVRSLLGYPDEKVVTISNTLNKKMISADICDDSLGRFLPVKNNEDIYLLTISHNYPHKNLKVIKSLLKKLPNNYKFILTVNDDFLLDIPIEMHDRVYCIGFARLNQCAYLYKFCDAVFLPTILECFSASYLESMYFNRVILTSDLPFARTICGDSAAYFNPYNEDDIALTIQAVFNDVNFRGLLLENSKRQLSLYPTPNDRAGQYIDQLNK